MSAPELYALEIPLGAYELLTRYWADVTTHTSERADGTLATTFIVALAGQMLNVPYERIHNTNPGKDEKALDAALAELIMDAMVQRSGSTRQAFTGQDCGATTTSTAPIA